MNRAGGGPRVGLRVRAAVVALLIARVAAAQPAPADAGGGDAAVVSAGSPVDATGVGDGGVADSAPTPAVGVAAPVVDSPDVLAARAHYRQGVVFFRAERYEPAIAEFLEAYSLWPNPTILYSLGQANERLLRVTRAIHYYRSYLERAPSDAPNRDEVEDTIRGLTTLLADVEVRTNVPAAVLVDGEEIGRAPGVVRLASGIHALELRAEGYEPARRQVVVAGRVRRVVDLALRRVVVARERGGMAPGWFWAATGATGAGLLTWGALGVATLAAAGAYNSASLPMREMQDEGRRLAIATDIALAGALAFGVVAAVLYFNVEWPRRPARPAPRQTP